MAVVPAHAVNPLDALASTVNATWIPAFAGMTEEKRLMALFCLWRNIHARRPSARWDPSWCLPVPPDSH